MTQRLLEELVSEASRHEEFKEAGKHLAKTTLNATQKVCRIVDTVLNPIASVHSAFEKAREYFSSRFPDDIQQKTASIPVNEIVEPKPSIAAPVLQGLAFAHEEDSLKDMYLNLLATAMDARKNGTAHPAFVEMIKQIDSYEAHFLKDTLSKLKSITQVIPIVLLQEVTAQTGGNRLLMRHVLNYRDKETGNSVEEPGLPTMVENWIRLGLIEVSYLDEVMADNTEDPYAWAKSKPEYIRLEKQVQKKGNTLECVPGVLMITSFGLSFAKAVGLTDISEE